MPLNFPDNPQQNDTFTVNGRTYTYRGNRWRRTKARLADVSPTLDVANDFTAGGALHVDSDTGRVGIGTANPQYELHVDGVGEVTGDFQVGQNLDVTGTVDINGLRLTSDGSTISLSEVLAGTYSTQAATTNDDTLATTAFVQSAIANLVDSAPGTLNTLNELAAALDDDPNFATTVTNSIALKLDSSAYTAADVLAKIKTVDGASSGLDADTLDGSHASAFAASSHTHSYAATIHTHSYHVAGGDYGTDFVGNQIFADNWFRAKGDTGLYFQDKGTGIRSPLSEGGQYGSVATYGNEGGWEGFSIGGRVVFMHNMSNNWGIYNDVNNEWMIYGDLNGSVDLYYNDAVKLYTDGSGAKVNGRLHATDVMYVGENGSGDSNIYFYDDNTNTWRTLQWDNSFNNWRVEDNGGTMRTLWHSGNSGGLAMALGSVNATSSYAWYLLNMPSGVNVNNLVSISPREGINNILYIDEIALGNWGGVQTTTQIRILCRLGNGVHLDPFYIKFYYMEDS